MRPSARRDIVCLADKLVRGDRVVGLDERFRRKLDQWSGDASACEAIAMKRARCMELKRRIEIGLGTTVDAVLETSYTKGRSRK